MVSELVDADKADLDHVIASKNLNFQTWEPDGAEAHVQGWNQLTGRDRANYLFNLSDHSALYAEIV